MSEQPGKMAGDLHLVWMDGLLAMEMDTVRAVMKTHTTSATTFAQTGAAKASGNLTLFPGLSIITWY